MSIKSKAARGEKDEGPVWIEDNLLLSLLGHPVHLELPLVLQLIDGDDQPLIVDSLHLLGSEVDQ